MFFFIQIIIINGCLAVPDIILCLCGAYSDSTEVCWQTEIRRIQVGTNWELVVLCEMFRPDYERTFVQSRCIEPTDKQLTLIQKGLFSLFRIQNGYYSALFSDIFSYLNAPGSRLELCPVGLGLFSAALWLLITDWFGWKILKGLFLSKRNVSMVPLLKWKWHNVKVRFAKTDMSQKTSVISNKNEKKNVSYPLASHFIEMFWYRPRATVLNNTASKLKILNTSHIQIYRHLCVCHIHLNTQTLC